MDILTKACCQPPGMPWQVLERIKDPLKSLISRDDPATVYVVLCHVLLLVQRAPFVFESDYVAFFCRTHDPAYIKKVKMEVSHVHFSHKSHRSPVTGRSLEYLFIYSCNTSVYLINGGSIN